MNSDKMFSLLVPVIRPVVVGRIGARRQRYFEAMPPPVGRVVFLGDSITQYVGWDDLFPDLRTANRGIGGETTSDLLTRLDSAIVEPQAVSLLIGTNDLHSLPRDRDIPRIAERMDRIVRRIRERAPDTPLLVNSVPPRTSHFADRIRELNAFYSRIAEQHGAAYIDLWPTFADQDGHIRREFTKDNLHLSPAGYLAWSDLLRPHLDQFAQR